MDHLHRTLGTVGRVHLGHHARARDHGHRSQQPAAQRSHGRFQQGNRQRRHASLPVRALGPDPPCELLSPTRISARRGMVLAPGIGRGLLVKPRRSRHLGSNAPTPRPGGGIRPSALMVSPLRELSTVRCVSLHRIRTFRALRCSPSASVWPERGRLASWTAGSRRTLR